MRYAIEKTLMNFSNSFNEAAHDFVEYGIALAAIGAGAACLLVIFAG
jgi:hypothetical protein